MKSNREKRKELQAKIKALDSLSEQMDNQTINIVDYKDLIKKEILELKNLKINSIKVEIKEDLKDIQTLQAIKLKINLGKKLSGAELLFFNLYF